MINLLSNNGKPSGGAAVEWYTWIKAFRQLGCEVGLLTHKDVPERIKQENDFDIVESYDLSKGLPFIKRFTHIIPYFYTALKDYNPDVILQGCAGINTGILALVARLLKKPFVHRIGSDMDVDHRINNILSKKDQLFYYYGIKRADHISCQNKYQYNILKQKYPDKSVSILYNPYFAKEPEFIQNERKYIAWIGNFRYEKNLPALAKTAESLKQYQFKIAGTRFNITDEDTKEGLNLLEKLKNVEFIGHIKNEKVPEFLSQAYCLLNTSRLEGFSNTFLESWSVGTPVVTTQNVNPDDIISNFDVGLVAENYDKLPILIERIISEKLYQKFEIPSKEYVRNNHDPLKLANQFLNEMKKIS